MRPTPIVVDDDALPTLVPSDPSLHLLIELNSRQDTMERNKAPVRSAKDTLDPVFDATTGLFVPAVNMRVRLQLTAFQMSFVLVVVKHDDTTFEANMWSRDTREAYTPLTFLRTATSGWKLINDRFMNAQVCLQ